MSESVKTKRPPRAPFDSQFAREESEVRSRGARSDRRAGSGEHTAVESTPSPDAPAPSRREAETVAERTTRIEHKVAKGTLLLSRLDPLDPKARLLGSAILRRDEVLLDAVLAQLDEELLSLSSSRGAARRR